MARKNNAWIHTDYSFVDMNVESERKMWSKYEYIASIQDHLEQHSDVLMDKLTEVVSYNFSPAIELLDFSAFIDPLRFEI